MNITLATFNSYLNDSQADTAVAREVLRRCAGDAKRFRRELELLHLELLEKEKPLPQILSPEHVHEASRRHSLRTGDSYTRAYKSVVAEQKERKLVSMERASRFVRECLTIIEKYARKLLRDSN